MRGIYEYFFSDIDIDLPKKNLDKNAMSKLLGFFTGKASLPLYLPCGKYSGMAFHQSFVLNSVQNPQGCSYILAGNVINDTGTTSSIHKVEGVLNIDFLNKTINYVADPG